MLPRDAVARKQLGVELQSKAVRRTCCETSAVAWTGSCLTGRTQSVRACVCAVGGRRGGRAIAPSEACARAIGHDCDSLESGHVRAVQRPPLSGSHCHGAGCGCRSMPAATRVAPSRRECGTASGPLQTPIGEAAVLCCAVPGALRRLFAFFVARRRAGESTHLLLPPRVLQHVYQRLGVPATDARRGREGIG